MKISVIIPAYNAEHYIAQAIASVLSEGVDDIVVVDDGSIDGTAQCAEAIPNVRVIRVAHAGIGTARNRGLAECRGEVLGFIDADDLWVKGRLKTQLDTLERHPDRVVLGEVEEFVCPEVARSNPELAARLVPKPGRFMGWLTGAMLLARATFDRVGPFPTDLEVGETIAWFARMKSLTIDAVELPHLVLRRRLHGTNTTLIAERRRTDYVALAKRLLDEKRRRSQ